MAGAVDEPDGDASAAVLDFRAVGVVDFDPVVVLVLDVLGAGEDPGDGVLGSGRCVVVAGDIDGDGFCGAVAAGPTGVVAVAGASESAFAGTVPRAGAGTPAATGGGGGVAGGGTRSSRRAYCMIRENTGAETWPP